MSDIICAHGFGVGADARGMFTDIAKAIQNYNFVTFDFNTIDPSENMTVAPLDKQVDILEAKLEEVQSPKIILGHSQGCVVVSMAKLHDVEQVIFLAPPDSLDLERFAKVFDRPGGKIDLLGTSSIPRRDGTTTYVSADYIDSIRNINIPELYEKLSKKCKLTIIRATEDEILGNTDFSYLDKAKIINITANHDFNKDSSRQELINNLKNLFARSNTSL